MKLATTKGATGRSALLERHRRDRGAAPDLRSRYPKLTTLQLEFNFQGTTAFLPSPQVMVLHPPARAYFRFACPYSDCDGEFDLTRPVAKMMDDRDSHSRGTLTCGGTRHGGSACTLSLEYSLAAQS